MSSGVQVGSLLPPLVSCELDVHNSLPQVFASLCPVGRKHMLCVKHELLVDTNWNNLRGAEAMALFLFFLLIALLLLSISFKDWEEGESNRLLVTFLQ